MDVENPVMLPPEENGYSGTSCENQAVFLSHSLKRLLALVEEMEENFNTGERTANVS